MWIYGLAIVVVLPVAYILSWRLPSRAGAAREAARLRDKQQLPSPEIPEGNSILPMTVVQKAIDEGAPRPPWRLGRDDRRVMDRIESYFAHAIPVPDAEGRAFIKETMGHGGPQLELYVPVLSNNSPVAILAVSWHSGGSTLESTVFFFGNVPRRLADVLEKSGFDRGAGPGKEALAAFRKPRSFATLRSA